MFSGTDVASQQSYACGVRPSAARCAFRFFGLNYSTVQCSTVQCGRRRRSQSVHDMQCLKWVFLLAFNECLKAGKQSGSQEDICVQFDGTLHVSLYLALSSGLAKVDTRNLDTCQATAAAAACALPKRIVGAAADDTTTVGCVTRLLHYT